MWRFMHIINIINCIKVDRTLLTVYVIDDIIWYYIEGKQKVNTITVLLVVLSVLYFAAVGNNTIITFNFPIHSYDGFCLDINNRNVI